MTSTNNPTPGQANGSVASQAAKPDDDKRVQELWEEQEFQRITEMSEDFRPPQHRAESEILRLNAILDSLPRGKDFL